MSEITITLIGFGITMIGGFWGLFRYLKEVRTELKGEILEFRSELKGDIQNVRAEMQDLRNELKNDIQRIEQRINHLDMKMDIERYGFDFTKKTPSKSLRKKEVLA